MSSSLKLNEYFVTLNKHAIKEKLNIYQKKKNALLYVEILTVLNFVLILFMESSISTSRNTIRTLPNCRSPHQKLHRIYVLSFWRTGNVSDLDSFILSIPKPIPGYV